MICNVLRYENKLSSEDRNSFVRKMTTSNKSEPVKTKKDLEFLKKEGKLEKFIAEKIG